MPKFGKKSLSLLEQVHPDLQKVLNLAIQLTDFSILESTIRTVEQQKQFVKEGKSKTMNSKHLKKYIPEYEKEYACAVDIIPYFSKEPHLDWSDREEFTLLAGVVLGIAKMLYDKGEIKHQIRWGGNWGIGNRIKDNSFVDMPHFEIQD